MVTMPAFVWRGGSARRALTVGGCVGLCAGVLALLDSGFLAVGALVFGVVGAFYGSWMAYRMARYWPESVFLSGEDRVTVVRAARRGEPVGDARLADFVASYSRGLRAAAEEGLTVRWLIAVVLAVVVAAAVWDGLSGSWGNLVVSVVYLAALLVEVFWWPGRRQEVVTNAHRAVELSC